MYGKIEMRLEWIRYVYELVWRRPLHVLYFGGPALMGYGFWANRAPTDICAELTGVTAPHWQQHPATCDALLMDHFDAFNVGVSSAAYFGLGAMFIVFGAIHMCCIRPLMN